MSLGSHALRKMRIIAVPLTRPTRKALPGKVIDGRILTYYQFQLSSKNVQPPSPTPAQGAKSENPSWIPEGGIANWITTKAADTWAGFGKSEGGWKLRVFQAGERLVDRLDFEELALKSIDPSLGPTIAHPAGGPALEEKEKVPGRLTIPLLFPSSVTPHDVSLSELRKYVEHRVPIHKKGFWMWLIIAPFTAPFMIIPIIPNLPFFFCAWRSWSHYKAYRSSRYLQSLLENDVIVPEPSKTLDVVYKEFPPSQSQSTSPRDSPPSSTSSTPPPAPPLQHTLLISRDAVPAIISGFGLKPSTAADLYRAIDQAQVRVERGELGL